MADCDLCTVAIPTVVPVRIFVPRFEHSYPEGIWKGLCESCLKSAKETADKLASSSSCGTAGKCNLCGAIAQLQPVQIFRPSFSKGQEEDSVMLCKKCLAAIQKADKEWQEQKANEHAEHH
ncbi:MAG: F420H2 dehydrogenase subunit FpoO [Methanomethylovorans sp.]|nr:F420H2 dehydrogenase subunit FpoO [Methanomethylovorans sp.]